MQIGHAQVKTGHTSEKLQSENHQAIYAPVLNKGNYLKSI